MDGDPLGAELYDGFLYPSTLVLSIHYKKEVITCDYEHFFFHFVSIIGFLEVMIKAMTSGSRKQSCHPNSATISCNFWSVI